MRKDSPDLTAGLDTPSGSTADRRPQTGLRRARATAWRVGIGALVLGTSAAAGSVAWWIVPPYLALMGVLLFEPAGRRVNATNPTGPASATPRGRPPGVSTDPADDEGPDSDDAPSPGESAATTGSGSSSATDPTSTPAKALKARRAAKGKGRKAKADPDAAPPEPSPATWLQVAPGKFVRVEPGNAAGPGPHPHRSSGESETPSAPVAASVEAPPLDTRDDPTEVATDLHPFDDATAAGPSRTDGPRDSSDAADSDLSSETDPLAPMDGPDASADPIPDHSEGDEPDEPEAESRWADDAPVAIEAGRPVDDLVPEDRLADPTEARRLAPEDAVPDHSDADAEGDEPDAEVWDETDGDPEDEADAEVVVDESESGEDNEDGIGTAEAHGPQPQWASSASPRFAGVPAHSPSRPGPPSRRAGRPSRADRLPAGFRRRSPRGLGRPARFSRAFPPRSPPCRRSVRA